MKIFLLKSCLILEIILLFSCNSIKSQETPLIDFTQSFPLKVKSENSLLANWAKKEILSSKLIDDMEGATTWKMNENIATLEYTKERFISGTQSLRYRTAIRDTAHIMLTENRSPWESFGGQQGGGSSCCLYSA